jgi:hypothetical protein
MRTEALLLTFSLLSCAFPIKSQQPLVGSIQGTIKNQNEVPIPYAGLTATNTDSVEPETHRRTTGADKRGFYQFVEVPPGHYSIVVKKSGYRNYAVPVVTVLPGETVTVPEIKMSPLANH